jgi:hypothetical protein
MTRMLDDLVLLHHADRAPLPPSPAAAAGPDRSPDAPWLSHATSRRKSPAPSGLDGSACAGMERPAPPLISTTVRRSGRGRRTGRDSRTEAPGDQAVAPSLPLRASPRVGSGSCGVGGAEATERRERRRRAAGEGEGEGRWRRRGGRR